MNAYVVVQRFNAATVNRGIPRMVFGPFTTYDAAEAFAADRERDDPQAEFLYSPMLLSKP